MGAGEHAAERLRALVDGQQVSRALAAAAELGLSDALVEGPLTVEELAARTGTHAPTLRRLLRALVTVGVYAWTGPDGAAEERVVVTELGALLRRDGSPSIAPWARYSGLRPVVDAWADLAASVRTGGNAFERVHGTSIWRYRAEHPEVRAVFDAAMTALSLATAQVLADRWTEPATGTVVDVGGGRGHLLAAVLERHPGLSGVLMDQPGLVADAEALLAERGVLERCTVVGGDFFAAVPPGGDVYVLKSVLHDWDDDEAATLLKACRTAMHPGARLLVVERLLDGPDAVAAAFSDLNMLVLPGGRERTRAEYAELLAAAGLRLRDDPGDAWPVGTGFSVLEAVPDGGPAQT